jgi:hypothetical protein
VIYNRSTRMFRLSTITFRSAVILPLALHLGILALTASSAWADDVFVLFTQHIRRQVTIDKQAFAIASTCTQWFYRREQRKPTPPPVQGVAWRRDAPSKTISLGRTFSPADCESRYPGGLGSVREDFSRTQSSLSLSLTFYEFALVGDRDDDGHYSTTELQDVLHSLELAFDPASTAAAHAAALTAAFDALHKAGGMERLMAGMGILYDNGYRLSASDQAALNRVME